MLVEEAHVDGTSSFGVAISDVSNGEILLVHIDDDERLTQLETLLMRFKPVEVHMDRRQVTPKTKRLLATTLKSPFYSFDTFLNIPRCREVLTRCEIDTATLQEYLCSDDEYVLCPSFHLAAVAHLYFYLAVPRPSLLSKKKHSVPWCNTWRGSNVTKK